MARTLPSPCTQPGCPELVSGGGRCKAHRRPMQKRSGRPDGGRVYDLSAWDLVRRGQLAREPLCRDCGHAGATTLAREVDHVVPIALGGAWFEPMNLQSLCKACHSRKTLRENLEGEGGSKT